MLSHDEIFGRRSLISTEGVAQQERSYFVKRNTYWLSRSLSDRSILGWPYTTLTDVAGEPYGPCLSRNGRRTGGGQWIAFSYQLFR